MQVKKINNLIISFMPSFQIDELIFSISANKSSAGKSSIAIDDFRNLYDFSIENDLCYELENLGEQFLHCANINPMVKILAGFLSLLKKNNNICVSEIKKIYKNEGNKENKYKHILKIKNENINCYNLFYSNKFTPRDTLACIENFNGLSFENTCFSFNNLDYNNEQKHSPSFYTSNQIYGHNFLLNEIKKKFNMFLSNYNTRKKNIIIIGSTPPLFNDFFDYLNSWNVNVLYFEYYDILIKSIDRNIFHSDMVLNITKRLENILGRISYYKKLNPFLKIGLIHIFPKFSHYELEDHFFNKNIYEKYLSLEYAGGGKLNERDKIRIESFIKIIN